MYSTEDSPKRFLFRLFFLFVTLKKGLKKKMAKKSLIARENKRRSCVRYYQPKREEIKKKMKKARSLEERLFLSMEFQALPRNSSPTRLTNRCFITGRPKGYYRDFGLSRHVFREMAHKCLLPGVRKSSW